MRRVFRGTTLAFLLVACSAWTWAADPPTINGDKQVDSGRLVRVSISALPPKAAVIWDISPEDKADSEDIGAGKLVFSGPAANYTIKARVIEVQPDGTVKVTTLRWLTTIGGIQPGPGPGPDPTPSPGNAPFPGDGFRVLIVYDGETVDKLPTAQHDVLFAKDVRDYLNAKTKTGSGGWKDFRIYSIKYDLSGDDRMWQDAMKRPRSSLPWIIVSNGTQWFEGPLPGTIADTLTLLKKYGG